MVTRFVWKYSCGENKIHVKFNRQQVKLKLLNVVLEMG